MEVQIAVAKIKNYATFEKRLVCSKKALESMTHLSVDFQSK